MRGAPFSRYTPQTVHPVGSLLSLSVYAVSAETKTNSIAGKLSSGLSQSCHQSRLKIPPPLGCGDCCNWPAAAHGPSWRSSMATSSSPNRSGQSNSPSSVRGSCQPIDVTADRSGSSRIGRHKCVQSPTAFDRICPVKSSSPRRCWITTKAPVFGSFRRVDSALSHQSIVDSIAAPLNASCAALGSSTTMIDPPSPVSADPTEVDRRDPRWSLSNLDLVF